MSLFSSLAAVLGLEERLRFEISGAGSALTVLVQPLLKTPPSPLNDEQQRLRAALAHPLCLTGTLEHLETELLSALTRYGEQRQRLQALVTEWETLDEAVRQAQQTVHQKRQKAATSVSGCKASSSSGDAADDPRRHAPAASAEDDEAASPPATPATPALSLTANPDSLF